MILEHAEVKDVFCWQRVSKMWQSTIMKSRHIQNKILFRSTTYIYESSKDNDHEMEGIEVQWNPLMYHLGSHRFRVSIDHGFFGQAIQNMGRDACYKLSANSVEDLGLGCPEASWKTSFVSKPAFHEAIVSWFDSERDWITEEKLRSKNGITMGDLSQALKKRTSRYGPRFGDLKHDSYLHISFSFCECFSTSRALDSGVCLLGYADKFTARRWIPSWD